jgi:hypothetical protein
VRPAMETLTLASSAPRESRQASDIWRVHQGDQMPFWVAAAGRRHRRNAVAVGSGTVLCLVSIGSSVVL